MPRSFLSPESRHAMQHDQHCVARVSLEIFSQPVWNLGQALAWICYADAAAMCDVTEAKYRQIVFYQTAKVDLLFKLLLSGGLTAFRESEEVPISYWVCRTPQWAELSKICCLSADLLHLMPIAGSASTNNNDQELVVFKKSERTQRLIADTQKAFPRAHREQQGLYDDRIAKELVKAGHEITASTIRHYRGSNLKNGKIGKKP